MPFFSIIIPVYNIAPYLRECLDSVLAQTFTDWEAICVDDGSTDGSGAILDEYAAKDKRFRIFHTSNGGVSSARNLALDKAEGEWVWFVDGDDAIHPKALDFLSRLIQVSNGARTISFTTQREGGEGEQVLGQWEDLPDVAQCITQDYIDAKSLRMHRSGAWATIVRADIAKQFVFKKYTIGEDVLYHMSVLWAHPETCLLSAPIYFYRTRSGSAIHGAVTKEKVCDSLTASCELLQLITKNAHHCKVINADEFYRWNARIAWYTFNGMFFRLSLLEQQKLLPLWVKVQKLEHTLVKPPRYNKFVLLVIQLIPLAVLCKLLVIGPIYMQSKYRALISRIDYSR